MNSNNISGNRFWVMWGIVTLIELFLLFLATPFIGFSFIVYVFLAYLLINLLKMNKNDPLYLQSPWFYESAKIIIFVTLITTTWVAYYMLFRSENELNRAINQPITETILAILLFTSFLSLPIGLMIAGIKSIKEKKSLTIGTNHVPVTGQTAIGEGLKYLIMGILLLGGMISGLLYIFLGNAR